MHIGAPVLFHFERIIFCSLEICMNSSKLNLVVLGGYCCVVFDNLFLKCVYGVSRRIDAAFLSNQYKVIC